MDVVYRANLELTHELVAEMQEYTITFERSLRQVCGSVRVWCRCSHL